MAAGSHTLYIIPRERLVAAGGTLTLATPSGTLSVDEEDILDGDVVLEDEEEEEEEILEEEEEVLEEEDDCLENPPD